MVYNESPFGYIKAILGEGKGCFFPRDPKTGRIVEYSQLELSLHNIPPDKQNFISTLSFPVSILGKGHLALFFKHMGYSELDDSLGK